MTNVENNMPWLSEIPQGWCLHPLYYYFREHKRKNLSGEETNLLSLSYGKIIRKDINRVDGLLPASYNGYNIVDAGDIVLRLTDLQNDQRSLRTGLVTERGIITSAYVSLRKIRDIDSRYFHYLLHAYDICKVFYAMGSGVRQGLNYSELSRLPLIEPPLDVQCRIVAFLDRKIADIDNLRSKIEEQIHTFKEYKRSTIYEIVSRGIHPEIQLGMSPLAWISHVPEHWKSSKFKYLFERSTVKDPGDVPVLSLYRELGVVPKESRTDNHNVTSEDTSKYLYCRPGSLVINKMKAWQGSVAISSLEGIVSPAYFVYNHVSDEVHLPYIHFLLRGCYSQEFERLSSGIRVGQWDLPAQKLEDIPILIPPLSEQISIAQYLNELSANIDTAIDGLHKQLSALASYRQALIFEYVTGKNEVPAT